MDIKMFIRTFWLFIDLRLLVSLRVKRWSDRFVDFHSRSNNGREARPNHLQCRIIAINSPLCCSVFCFVCVVLISNLIKWMLFSICLVNKKWCMMILKKSVQWPDWRVSGDAIIRYEPLANTWLNTVQWRFESEESIHSILKFNCKPRNRSERHLFKDHYEWH